MFDFHEKRRIRAIIYSKIFIALIIFVGIFIARSAYERYTVEREMAEKRNEKFVELKELNERQEYLEKEIARLQDDRGVEEELRSRFDAVREGEQVIVILDDASLDARALEALEKPLLPAHTNPVSWWNNVLNALKFW